jgi:hypothetical protein
MKKEPTSRLLFIFIRCLAALIAAAVLQSNSEEA